MRRYNLLNAIFNFKNNITLMRIAILSAEYPPKWGGLGTHAYYLSKELVKLGNEVHVITRKERKEFQEENTNIHKVKWIPLPLLFSVSYGENAFYKMKELGNFDIAHCHYPMIALKNSYLKEIKNLVASFHGTWFGERQSILEENPLSMDINDFAIRYCSKYFEYFEKLGLENANQRITVSEFSAEEIAKNYAFERDKINVVPNGVDTSEFIPMNCKDEIKEKYGFAKDDFILLFVGRFFGRKGIEYLLYAMKKVLTKKKNVKLILVGRGLAGNRLKKLAKELKISENVFFAFSLSIKELVKHYASADIFVLPSLYEGQGIVLLESFSCGIPAICSKIGGVIGTLRENENGIFFEKKNSDDLAEKILFLLENEELRIKLGKEARKIAIKEFDWKIIAKRTEEIYKEVIE